MKQAYPYDAPGPYYCFLFSQLLLVGGMAYWYAVEVPFLRNEPLHFFLFPVVCIAGLVAPSIYPALRAAKSKRYRLGMLYAGFFAGLCLYGLYLSCFSLINELSRVPPLPQPEGWWRHFGMLPLVVVGGHWFAFPILLATFLYDLLLGIWLYPSDRQTVKA